MNDIYKYFVKNKDDKHYLMVSRIAAIACGIGITYLMLGIFSRYELLMTALFSLFSAVMPGMLIVTVGGLLTTKIPPRAATACILACIIGTFAAIFVPDTFLRPFVLLGGAPYPSAGAGYFNNLAGLIWGVLALLIFWPFSKPRPKEELLGTVWNYPSTNIMKEIYFTAMYNGKRGVIDMKPAEVKEIVDGIKQGKIKLKDEEEDVVKVEERQIKVKESAGENMIFVDKDTMKILGVEENDMVIIQKGSTGLSSARGFVKEDPELAGKNTVAVSRNVFESGNFKERDTVKIWKHTSWT